MDDVRWFFYFNLPSGWHWRTTDADGKPTGHSHSFITLSECRTHAASNGWDAERHVTVVENSEPPRSR